MFNDSDAIFRFALAQQAIVIPSLKEARVCQKSDGSMDISLCVADFSGSAISRSRPDSWG